MSPFGKDGASGKEPACPCKEMQETRVRSLGWEDPLEEGMATHSSILAWRISRTEELGRLQSIESGSRARVKQQCAHKSLLRHIGEYA